MLIKCTNHQKYISERRKKKEKKKKPTEKEINIPWSDKSEHFRIFLPMLPICWESKDHLYVCSSFYLYSPSNHSRCCESQPPSPSVPSKAGKSGVQSGKRKQKMGRWREGPNHCFFPWTMTEKANISSNSVKSSINKSALKKTWHGSNFFKTTLVCIFYFFSLFLSF